MNSRGASGTELALNEAVPLCQAWAVAFLQGAGIRALAIKGPVFVLLQVRRPRQSNDVDVLVDPSDFDRARDLLFAAGWELFIEGLLHDVSAVHSLTLAHPLWACTLDLHHHFPGILREPQSAFDVLWGQRCEVTVAHRSVTTLNRPAAFIVESLNSLRNLGVGVWSAEGARLVTELPSPFTPEELNSFIECVPRLAAARTLEPVLRSLGVTTRSEVPEDSRLAVQWDRYARFGTPGSAWTNAVQWRRPIATARALIQHLVLGEQASQRWASAQGIPYRGRISVMLLRIRRGLSALGEWRSRGRPTLENWWNG